MPFVPNPMAALARSRSGSGTRPGTADRDAGWNTAATQDWNRDKEQQQGRDGSVSAMTATIPPWTSSQLISTARWSHAVAHRAGDRAQQARDKIARDISSATARPVPKCSAV